MTELFQVNSLHNPHNFNLQKTFIQNRLSIYQMEKSDLLFMAEAIRSMQSKDIIKTALYAMQENIRWQLLIPYETRISTCTETRLKSIFSAFDMHHWAEFFKESGLIHILPQSDHNILSLGGMGEFTAERAGELISSIEQRYTPELVRNLYGAAFIGLKIDLKNSNAVSKSAENIEEHLNKGIDVIISSQSGDDLFEINYYCSRKGFHSVSNTIKLNKIVDLFKGLIALNDPDWINSLRIAKSKFDLQVNGIEIINHSNHHITIKMTKPRAFQLQSIYELEISI